MNELRIEPAQWVGSFEILPTLPLRLQRGYYQLNG